MTGLRLANAALSCGHNMRAHTTKANPARPCDNGHDLKQKEPGSVATRTKRGDAPADFRRDE
jgi:hypothetical protein